MTRSGCKSATGKRLRTHILADLLTVTDESDNERRREISSNLFGRQQTLALNLDEGVSKLASHVT